MNSVNSVKCLIPFTQLLINAKGYCNSCCSIWTILGNIGRLKEKSIMDIWNGEEIQYIRKAILENKLEKVCNFKFCPIAIENRDIDITESWGDAHYKSIIEQVQKGQTKLETAPYTIGIASSGKCNLKCITCESNEKVIPDNDGFDEYLYSKLLPELSGKVSMLQLTGFGDPLFNKHSLNFLQNLDTLKFPTLQIKLITNGNLFTPKIWDSIKHNNYGSINVSIDAATKETYENIRINGKWDLLMINLKLISNLREQHIFKDFAISFIVLKSNYKELKKFVELGIQLGCDKVVFQKNFSYINAKENINLIHDKKVMIEIAKLLCDPIFKRPEVDTILIDEYKSYLSSKSNMLDKLLTKFTANILYYPLLSLYSMIKVVPFIIDIAEYYKKVKPKLLLNRYK
jgi:sulfatase maturation enzyme AslB (radical SAM superfamily)